MLTVKQCEAIRRNWDAANCMDSDSVAEMGERHVPNLLDTVEELRERLEDVADHIEQGASSQIIRAHIAKALE